MTSAAEYEHWSDAAKCKGLSLHFDQDTEQIGYISREELQLCRDICATCPVKSECLQDALDHSDEYTFRAGMTAGERVKLMNKLGIPSWYVKQQAIRRQL